MKSLWSDGISESLKAEWTEGSYCDRLMKDVDNLKARPAVDTAKCKGCLSAPYDRQYARCLTCIKHTKFERQKIIKYLRLADHTIWNTKEDAEGVAQNSVKMEYVRLTED